MLKLVVKFEVSVSRYPGDHARAPGDVSPGVAGPLGFGYTSDFKVPSYYVISNVTLALERIHRMKIQAPMLPILVFKISHQREMTMLKTIIAFNKGFFRFLQSFVMLRNFVKKWYKNFHQK